MYNMYKFMRNRILNKQNKEDYCYEESRRIVLTLLLLLSASSFALAEDITLDVIICQYGPNTSDWFTHGPAWTLGVKKV